MKKSIMKKQNWILVVVGILMTYFGFFLVSFVTTNYDGPYAFVSLIQIVLGLVVLTFGLSVNFAPAKEIEAENPDR